MLQRNVGLLGVVVIFLVSNNLAWANWVQDGASLNGNTTQGAFAPSIAVKNNIPYVAWCESQGSALQIFVKYLNGNSWVQQGGSLNVSTACTASGPILAFSNTTPNVIWQENTSMWQWNIYTKYWYGNNWVSLGGSLRVYPGDYHWPESPCIAINNDTPYATWAENNGYKYVNVKHWNGAAWVQDGGILNVNSNQDAASAKIIIFNNYPYVAWCENSGYYQLYVKKWNGSAWSPLGGSLNNNTLQSAASPNMVIHQNQLHITWVESNGTENQLYVKRWDGFSWVQLGPALNLDTAKDANAPVMASFNDVLYLAWIESNGTADQLNIKYFRENNWANESLGVNLNVNKNASGPSMAVSTDKLYIAWNEPENSISQIYVKHWVAPTATPTPALTATATATLLATNPGVLFTSTKTNSDSDRSLKIYCSKINPKRGERAIIRWTQPQTAPMTVEIYNMVGDKIVTLVNHREYSSGQRNEVTWDGRNTSGNIVGSGIYIVYIRTADYEAYSKIAVIK